MMSSYPPETNRPDAVPPGGLAHPPMARPITAPHDTPSPLPDPMLLREVGRWACLLDAAGFVLGVFASLLLGAVIAKIVAPGVEGGDSRYQEVGAVVGSGVFAVALAVAITKRRGLRLACLGLTGTALWVNAAVGFAATVATLVMFWFGCLVVFLFWPAGFEELVKNPQRILERLPPMGPAALVGFTVVVSIWEEVAFRGFLLPRLRRMTRSWIAAVLLSSAFFALLHVTMQTGAIVIPLFFIAILWCTVTIWRRSLIPAVIAHFFLNIINLLWMTANAPEWQ